MRIYDYRCRSCGLEKSITAESDPGKFLCNRCPRTIEIVWWRMRPEHFTPPDLTGLTFGPSPEELAEERRPFSRNRDDLESMLVPLKVPEIAAPVAEQLSFLGGGSGADGERGRQGHDDASTSKRKNRKG